MLSVTEFSPALATEGPPQSPAGALAAAEAQRRSMFLGPGPEGPAGGGLKVPHQGLVYLGEGSLPPWQQLPRAAQKRATTSAAAGSAAEALLPGLCVQPAARLEGATVAPSRSSSRAPSGSGVPAPEAAEAPASKAQAVRKSKTVPDCEPAAVRSKQLAKELPTLLLIEPLTDCRLSVEAQRVDKSPAPSWSSEAAGKNLRK